MIDDSFIPTRMKDIQNYHANIARERMKNPSDEHFAPLQCLEPQLSLWNSQWVAGCQCGWSHSDPDYDIVWEERKKHVDGRFDRE